MSDYDLPSVFTETMRVGYKAHKCCECEQEIPKKSLNYHVKGCWEHKWYEFKTCSHCQEQRREYTAEVSETPPFGMLKEWCEESDIKFWSQP